jgi:hypothetical protein
VYGLSWAVPAWIGNGTYYSTDNIAYQTSWVSCIQDQSGFPVDYLGLWNEKPQPTSTDYVVELRASLDAAGAASTQLIIMDGGYSAQEVAWAADNATFLSAVHGAGLHYPCNNPQPAVRDLGWVLWASEDYSAQPGWSDGASLWAQALNQNYVLNNMTATSERAGW